MSYEGFRVEPSLKLNHPYNADFKFRNNFNVGGLGVGELGVEGLGVGVEWTSN